MKSSTFELGLRSTTLQSSTTRPSKLYNYLCKTKKMNDFAVPRVFLTPSSFCKQCYSKYFHIWSERWELFLNVDFSSDTTIVLAELEYIMEVIKQALKFKYGSQYAHCFLTFGRPRCEACRIRVSSSTAPWSTAPDGCLMNSQSSRKQTMNRGSQALEIPKGKRKLKQITLRHHMKLHVTSFTHDFRFRGFPDSVSAVSVPFITETLHLLC